MNDYIEGVYNYCDRWCERCAFTSRCRSFALEKQLEEADKESANGNISFWDFFESLFDTVTPKESETSDVYEEKDCFSIEDFEPEQQIWDSKEERKAENHSLFKAARLYSIESNNWLNQYEKEVVNCAEKKRISKDTISDAIEVILHYAFFIPVKIARAIDGLRDEEQEPSDSLDVNGSAKVALIAISRSITGWSIIRSVYKKDFEVTGRFLGKLFSVRRSAEQLFPKAMDFVRPGFDTGQQAG